MMMMRRLASTYCDLHRHRGGMPFLQSSVFFNKYFHSHWLERRKYKTSSKARLLEKVRRFEFERYSKSPEITNEDALNLFNTMLETRPLPPIVDFNKILGQLVKLKRYSAAISLCKQMDVLRIVPNVCTLNIMINCFCHLGQMGSSLSVVAKLFKSGFKPEVATYNTLIKGFVMEDRIAEAAALFCKLLKEAPSYSFTKVGPGQPNVRTYTVMISGLCSKGLISEAENVLTQMKERGCSPNSCTYNTIVRACINNKETTTAMRLIQEMVDGGFWADATTVNWVADSVANNELDPELVRQNWYFRYYDILMKAVKNRSI